MKNKNTLNRIKYIMLVVSIVVIFITNSNFKLEEIKYGLAPNWEAIKDIACNISLSIISTLIVIFFIDQVRENIEAHELSLRKQRVYTKISTELKSYYELYINIYKATTQEGITANSEILDNVFCNMKDFKNKFYQLDILSDGYYGNMRQTFSWLRCIIESSILFKNKIGEIQIDYGQYIDIEVLEAMDRMIEKIRPMENLLIMFQPGVGMPSTMNAENFYEWQHLDELIKDFVFVIEYIETELNQPIRKADLKKLNNDFGVSWGSGLKQIISK